MKIKFKNILLVAVAIILLIEVVMPITYYLVSNRIISAKITNISRTSNDGTFIYIKDDPFDWGFIRNNDSIILGKWDSGVSQGKLEIGHVCELKVYGFRIPLLSAAPNLYKVISCN